MPIYDYACTVCGRVTEVIHGINAEGPRFCPACGAEGSMRKAVSSPSIVFKGSGWAKLDRRGSSGSGSSGSGSGKSRAGGATKGDSGTSDGSKAAAGSGEGSGSSGAPSAPASSSGSED